MGRIMIIPLWDCLLRMLLVSCSSSRSVLSFGKQLWCPPRPGGAGQEEAHPGRTLLVASVPSWGASWSFLCESQVLKAGLS